MVYDFDESRQLNVDETILALRSTVRYYAVYILYTKYLCVLCVHMYMQQPDAL
jgi:hypothetical protein